MGAQACVLWTVIPLCLIMGQFFSASASLETASASFTLETVVGRNS